MLLENGASMIIPVRAGGKVSSPLQKALEGPEMSKLFVKRLQELEKNSRKRPLSALISEIEPERKNGEEPPRKKPAPVTPDF